MSLADTETEHQEEIQDEAIEVETEAEGTANAGESEQVETKEESAEDESEVIVSIGEETPPPEDEQTRAPEWVRELRKQHRELQKKNRELEAKLATPAAENKPAALGKKPTLEDHDYDSEKFEQALESWYERKRSHDEAAAKADAEVKAKQQEWQAKLDAYGKAKAELKVRDYEDAEAHVQEVFDVTQQGVLLQGAENPALLVYALGKNPKRTQELASIKDPVKFAFAVAKLETQLKVTNRTKAAPPPEKSVKGNTRISGSVDSTLERLRAEAEKTGNYTKVMQYKRQKQAA